MRHHPASHNYGFSLWNSAVFEPVSAALVAIGSVVQAGGTIAAGNAARREGNFRARQLEQAAGQERATSQRAAIEETRKADLAISRAQALGAASGAGAADVGMTNIIKGIAGQGEYNALTALFEGEERARGLKLQADTARLQGKQARKAAVVSAIGNTISTMGQAAYMSSKPSGADGMRYGADGYLTNKPAPISYR